MVERIEVRMRHLLEDLTDEVLARLHAGHARRAKPGPAASLEHQDLGLLLRKLDHDEQGMGALLGWEALSRAADLLCVSPFELLEPVLERVYGLGQVHLQSHQDQLRILLRAPPGQRPLDRSRGLLMVCQLLGNVAAATRPGATLLWDLGPGHVQLTIAPLERRTVRRHGRLL